MAQLWDVNQNTSAPTPAAFHVPLWGCGLYSFTIEFSGCDLSNFITTVHGFENSWLKLLTICLTYKMTGLKSPEESLEATEDHLEL